MSNEVEGTPLSDGRFLYEVETISRIAVVEAILMRREPDITGAIVAWCRQARAREPRAAPLCLTCPHPFIERPPERFVVVRGTNACMIAGQCRACYGRFTAEQATAAMMHHLGDMERLDVPPAGRA